MTLSKQTSCTLVLTLKYHASLIEDLLSGEYEYFITVRPQSDPLERRFGHYRQRSRSRISVFLKNIYCSETIVKIRSLLKEDIDLSESNVSSIKWICLG